MFNERLSNSIKQLKDNTIDLEESLTVNQDLVERKLNTSKSQLKVIQSEISKNKAEQETLCVLTIAIVCSTLASI